MSSAESEFEEVTTIDHPQQSSTAAAQEAGGFLVDDDASMGGGFLPEEDEAMSVSYTGAGGFVPGDGSGDAYGGGGGFLPEEGYGGGGFLPEASSWNGSSTGGGGFLPEDVDLAHDQPRSSTSRAQPSRHTTTAGGFLPDTAYSAQAQLGSERIALSAIPAALKALPWNLPVAADSHELMALFEEIASEDELLGEPSVARDKFDAACEDLRVSDDEDEGDQGDEEEDEPVRVAGRRAQPGRKARPRVSFEDEGGSDSGSEEEFVPDEEERSARRRPRGATKSTTAADVLELDSGSEFDEDEEVAKPSKKGKGATPKKAAVGNAKSKTKRGDRNVDARQIAGAQDTFDLFFEGSRQFGAGKTIGIDELKRVAGLLNEKIDDLEMKEMLEYALSGAGTGAVGGVDLKAFAGLLAEIE